MYWYYVINNKSLGTDIVVMGLWRDGGGGSALSPIYLDGLLKFFQIMPEAMKFAVEIVTVDFCSMEKVIMETILGATYKGGGPECGQTVPHRFNMPGISNDSLLLGPMTHYMSSPTARSTFA